MIEGEFGKSPSKMRIVTLLLKHGLAVKADSERGRPEAYLGELRVPYSSIARAAATDWRTVKETLERIRENAVLREFFEKLENAGLFLRQVTSFLGQRCIVVETFHDEPGILAYVSGLLAERKINILQVIAEHPLLTANPKLYVIIEGEIPGDVLPMMLRHRAIKSVTIY